MCVHIRVRAKGWVEKYEYIFPRTSSKYRARAIARPNRKGKSRSRHELPERFSPPPGLSGLMRSRPTSYVFMWPLIHSLYDPAKVDEEGTCVRTDQRSEVKERVGGNFTPVKVVTRRWGVVGWEGELWVLR